MAEECGYILADRDCCIGRERDLDNLLGRFEGHSVPILILERQMSIAHFSF